MKNIYTKDGSLNILSFILGLMYGIVITIFILSFQLSKLESENKKLKSDLKFEKIDKNLIRRGLIK